MDVFLTTEAERFLKALGFLSKEKPCGYLIGHRRGPRILIEAAVPAGKNGSFTYARLRQLDRLYDGKTEGFFFFGAGHKAKTRLLKPYAYGKLCLEVRLDRGQNLILKASTIEYDGRFYFLSIPLAASPGTKKHGL